MRILNELIIHEEALWLPIVCIFLVLGIGLLISAVACASYDGNKKAERILFIILAAASVTLVVLLVIQKSLQVSRTQYEVYLDDNYSATQLLDKYDVVEIRGEIYVLEEKENE